MVACPECGRAMIRADLYDPEGVIPLYGGKMESYPDSDKEYWWVCLGGGCPDGDRNRNRWGGITGELEYTQCGAVLENG